MGPARSPAKLPAHVVAMAATLLLAACANHPHRPEPTFRESHSSLADLPARAPSAAGAATANDVLFRAIALVALSTGLTEVPRSWRTPSAMPFMPWM